MIANKKISGLVVLSEPSWGCYPFIESITSFLSVVDELVVAFNVYGRQDGSREKIMALNASKVRIVPTVFDIEKYGWASYGIARTMGYQACKGDVVLMFDGDGILHEKDIQTLVQDVTAFISEGWVSGYWNKYRTYKPTLYYNQYKHSGIYNKEKLGERLDFFRSDGKGAPHFSNLTPQEERSKSFHIFLFGYEHVWDTKEVLQFKVNRYGRMIDGLYNKPFKTPEQYFDEYMRSLVNKVNKEGKSMPISNHPAIIQKKLREVNETHFGFDFFGYK
jgi:glycosyltransferase involved in cell wall biosynthesis